MLEVLDKPELRSRLAPISVERYHRMIELGVFDDWPVELLNGVLVEKMSKSPIHIFLTDLLLSRLQGLCSESRFWVRKEDPITIGDSEPEPDISVVQGNRAQFKFTKPTTACFVIEVAVTSLALDRAKATEYAKAGVPEYWIVSPEDRRTEVYRGPVNGAYTSFMMVDAEETILSTAIAGFEFCLAAELR